MDSIIFDVDGTLWDSTEICAKAWTDVIHRETSLSLTINASTLKGLFGRLLPDIASVLFADYPKEEQLRLIDRCCQEEHKALLAQCAPLYPDLEKTLQQLKENYHKKHILALCIDTPSSTRIQRMKDRGDTSDVIDERMKKDESAFEEAYDLCDAVINNEGSLSMTCLNIMAELERFKRQIRDTEGATTKEVDQNN